MLMTPCQFIMDTHSQQWTGRLDIRAMPQTPCQFTMDTSSQQWTGTYSGYSGNAYDYLSVHNG